MEIAEQLNELDRKVLGAAPVDRAEPAAPYEPAVGELAPLGRSLIVRALLYAVGAVALSAHMLLGGDWKTLLVCLVLVLVPAMLVGKLSSNSFPVRFPEAPAEALATRKVSRTGRLVKAVAVAAICLADLVLLSGKGEEVLFVFAALPAVLLCSIAARVSEREEDGYVLASRVQHSGRFGRGIYRVRQD